MHRTPAECRVVTQRGVVTRLDESVAQIQIIQRSACASCAVKAMCAPSETREREVTVDAAGLRRGMTVDISMDERLGWLGVLVAFVLPLILVVGALFGLRGPLGSDEAAVGVGLGLLFPYFTGIYLMRGWFGRIVTFEATPVTPSSVHLVEGGAQ